MQISTQAYLSIITTVILNQSHLEHLSMHISKTPQFAGWRVVLPSNIDEWALVLQQTYNYAQSPSRVKWLYFLYFQNYIFYLFSQQICDVWLWNQWINGCENNKLVTIYSLYNIFCSWQLEKRIEVLFSIFINSMILYIWHAVLV